MLAFKNRLLFILVEAEALELVTVVVLLIIFLFRVIDGVVVLEEVDFVVLTQNGADKLLFPIYGLRENVVFLLQFDIVFFGFTPMLLNFSIGCEEVIVFATELLDLYLKFLEVFIDLC